MHILTQPSGPISGVDACLHIHTHTYILTEPSGPISEVGTACTFAVIEYSCVCVCVCVCVRMYVNHIVSSTAETHAQHRGTYIHVYIHINEYTRLPRLKRLIVDWLNT